MTHPGQFSILKKPLSLPDWQTLSLSGGWVLSFHKKLDVFYLPKHGLLLLGLAWQVLPGKPSPEQELRELSESTDGPITDEQLMALGGVYSELVSQQEELEAMGRRRSAV